jgi:hypothetical protein
MAMAMVVLEVEVGVWRMVTKNVGITIMHVAMALLTRDVVLLHCLNNGPSNMTSLGLPKKKLIFT